ncbi:MAG TPA: EamA family transporter, partial [Candidatus Accumulibacter phosphatis]|nr:EamA family transporter [Candidatus Accumulibacter phosphatis]
QRPRVASASRRPMPAAAARPATRYRPDLALALLLEGWPAIDAAISDFSLRAVAAVAYLAWAATLLGYGLWTRLLGRYPVNQVAPFSLLVPLVGLTTGWLAFGEALQPLHFAGAALLMLGLAINLFGGRLLPWRRARR